MTRSIKGAVYIAAPLRAATPEGRERNVQRAHVVAKLAVHKGLAPVLVHGLPGWIWAEDDEVGLACDVHLVRSIARNGGYMWVLLRDDGTESDGCLIERAAFEEAGGMMVESFRWQELEHRCSAAGIAPMWRALESDAR